MLVEDGDFDEPLADEIHGLLDLDAVEAFLHQHAGEHCPASITKARLLDLAQPSQQPG